MTKTKATNRRNRKTLNKTTRKPKFGKSVGRSLNSQDREARITLAKRLLETTELLPGVIAQQCGYASHSSFGGAFNTAVGMSPSEYRRRVAAKAQPEKPRWARGGASVTATTQAEAKQSAETTFLVPVEIVDIRELGVCDAYQRELNAGFVRRVSRELDLDSFGVPVVGRRADGSLKIADGLRRISAASLAGYTRILCEVFESNGEEHESQVFLRINKDRTGVSPCDKFKASVTAKDDVATAAQAVLDDYGLQLVTGRSAKNWPEIGCASALLSIVKRHGKAHLALVIDVLTRAWGNHVDALRAIAVSGMSQFLIRSSVDIDFLVERLSTVSPLDVIHSADDLSKLATGGRAHVFAAAVEVIYNDRRRTTRKSAKRARSRGKQSTYAGRSRLTQDFTL